MTTSNPSAKPAQKKEMAGTSDPLLSRAMADRGHAVCTQIAALCTAYAAELAKDGHGPGAEYFTKTADAWTTKGRKWYPTKESKIAALEAELAKLKTKA